jgi:flagellar hook protein FlgE
MFLPSENSGDAQVADETDGRNVLLNHMIERSATDLATEMTNMMLAQKAYSFSARIVSTADEIEDLTNNLR